MSTKIYDAFATEARSLEEARELLAAHGATIQGLVDGKVMRWVARHAAQLVDAAIFHRFADGIEANIPSEAKRILGIEDADGMRPDPAVRPVIADESTALVRAWHEWETRQRNCRITQRRDPSVDADVEAVLYFDPGSNRALGRVIEERVGVLKHLLSVAGIKDYSFTNQVECPADIPLADWEERERSWERAWSASAPRTSVKWEPLWQPRADAADLPFPSLGQRAYHFASREVKNQYLQQHLDPDPAKVRPSHVVDCMVRAQEALDDPSSALSQQLAGLRARYASMLPGDEDMHQAVTMPLSSWARQGVEVRLKNHP